MSLIKPFAGLRPAASHATDVVAPPYDVMNAEEACEMASGRPWSFLHISRPEIDLPQGTDPYSREVYEKGAQNMARMLDEGILVRDPAYRLYVYRMIMGDHEQTGLVAAASVADYDTNRIRRHEFTRPAKEDDRVRQIEALNAQTGPVLLAFGDAPDVEVLLGEQSSRNPDANVTAEGGVHHALWVVDDDAVIRRLVDAFDAMPALYIADGHHRSAAASRVSAARRGTRHGSADAADGFLSVIFPAGKMKILDYNRVVRDLNGLSEDGFLDRVAARFSIAPASEAVRPAGQAEFGMYLGGRWYRLNLDESRIPVDDPVARLDISLLSDNLIEPVLGISDPRRDDRIDFIGGIRGLEALERRVDSGEMAVAFSLYPTRMDDLMSVADAGEVMPPKSTWFEPKLVDGLVSLVLD
ncbi:MAG: DUF1015 family protein [Pseudomonadota bacterium]|nr:DUF1015 family protein [Pseudomonadota bacterium]